MNPFILYPIIIAIVLVIIIFLISYIKVPPSIAGIISGLSKQPRILIGRGGIRIPFFERCDQVYLGQITVDIKTDISVPTKDFIDVSVDAVAKVRVLPTIDNVQLVAKNFLNMRPDEIAYQLQDSLQGNMREIIGTLELKELNNDRDGFSDQVAKKASVDMAKLGIEIISCNIQNISDTKGLISCLGADNVAKITKEAAITKANAERDVAIETSKAKELANAARITAETLIAEQNTNLAIKQADLKQQSDTKKAISDAAYEIQKQEQQKAINTKTIDAEIEKTKRLQTLSAEDIVIKENQLIASVNKKADADKYNLSIQAEAELEQKKRKAEADLYTSQRIADAKKVDADAIKYQLEKNAEAVKYQMKQKAEGIEAEAKAEAEAIRMKGEAEAKGIAEAEAMEKKAEAYNKYGEAAIAEMAFKVLPEMTKSISNSLSAIKEVNIYGTNGDGISNLSGNVPVIMTQMMDTMTSATGVDMKTIIQANSIDAKVNRNLHLSRDNNVVEALSEIIK